MFDFNQALANCQDRQLASHIDHISRQQLDEWAEEEAIEAMYDETFADLYDDLLPAEQDIADALLKIIYERRRKRERPY